MAPWYGKLATSRVSRMHLRSSGLLCDAEPEWNEYMPYSERYFFNMFLVSTNLNPCLPNPSP